MDTGHIEAFIYVALTGSFSKAGEMLFLTQPTISSRIKSLENDIGYSLFERSGKNVALNEAGKTFLPFAKQILQGMQEGKLSVHRSTVTTEGELQLSSVMSVANYFLPSVVKEFNQKYPKVKLGIHTRHSHQVLDMVLHHEVPIGIARSIDHPEIKSIRLIQDDMVLVVYPNHPFSRKTIISIADVANEPLILFNRGSLDRTLIHSVFDKNKLEPNVVMEVDSIEAAKQMVKQEIGLAILSRLTLNEEINHGYLKTIEISDMPQIQRDVDLIFLKDKRFHGITKLFVDFITQHSDMENMQNV
jgi:DNA-binding transcriptional LysR family regulator